MHDFKLQEISIWPILCITYGFPTVKLMNNKWGNQYFEKFPHS